MLLFKRQSISNIHCPRLGPMPAPCLELDVELLRSRSCKRRGERWEARAGIRGPGAQQHSQCCLSLLQMLCHFSHRSSGGVSGVRLRISRINKKVIISSCFKTFA